MSEHLTFSNTEQQREKGLPPTVLIERSRSGEILTATATGRFDAGKELYEFTEDGEKKLKGLGRISLSDETQDRLAEQLAADRPLSVEQGEYDDTLPSAREIGEAALDAAGVEAPAAVQEQESVSEQDLLEAKNLFEERLNKLMVEYAGVSNHYKDEIKAGVERLGAMRGRLRESSENAFRYLRNGIDQPDRVRHAVTLAIEELTGVNRMLGNVLEAVEAGRTANGSLGNQADTHKGDAARLYGEFRADTGRIIDEYPGLDRAALGQIDATATEMTTRRAVDANQLKEVTLELGVVLRQIEDDTDTTKQRTRNLLGRLEDIKGSISRGRLNSSEYEGIVRSASVLARELQDNRAVRRFATLAKGL